MTREEAITRVLARINTVWPGSKGRPAMSDAEIEEWIDTLLPFVLGDALTTISLLKRTDEYRPSHRRFVETVNVAARARITRHNEDVRQIGTGQPVALLTRAHFVELRRALTNTVAKQRPQR